MQALAARLRIPTVFCTSLLLSVALVSRLQAADITVDAIVVEPASPLPLALCGLKVQVKNGGTQAVSYFRFSVKIDGQELPMYKQQTYAVDVAAGTSGELALYSFYSPPAPKPFEIQIALVEAQWVEVKKDGTRTTTTPSGPVAGLPTSATVSVKMSSGK
jgi:hypothetical protein